MAPAASDNRQNGESAAAGAQVRIGLHATAGAGGHGTSGAKAPAGANAQPPAPARESMARAWADEHGAVWEYEPLAGGGCAIVRAMPAQPHLAVPSSIEGMAVEAIAAEACMSCELLRSISFPASVRSIGRKAFAYNANLERMDLPPNLRDIGDFAFMHTGLREANMPPSLRRLGDNAFYCCQQLTSATLNDGLASIGERAFEQTALAELHVPRTVEQLGARTLHPKDAAQPVRLFIDPANPSYLGSSDGFTTYLRGENGLELVECRGNQPTVDVLEGTRSIGPRAFMLQKLTRAVGLPEGVQRIGEAAFRGCTGLRELRLPATLEAIGPNAFFGCGLRQLRLPAGLRAVDDSAFLVNGSPHARSHRHALKLEIDPANPQFFMRTGVLCERLEDGSERAIIYTETCAAVSIPASVKHLGRYLFYGAAGIEDLALHNGIAAFDSQAFGVLCPIHHVHMTTAEPLDGRQEFDLYFMRNGSFSLNFIQAFHGGCFDVASMIEASDTAICYMTNGFERATLMLQRLNDPFRLSARHEKQMRRAVENGLGGICTEFAERGCTEGFERLLDLGFINASNVDEAIQAAHEAGSVSSASYLLEMKRRRFGETVFSSYDL